jgi:hypothetical protein
MPLKNPDATRDTTTTTGTGPFAVTGTGPTGYHTFSEKLSVDDTFYGFIRHRTADEFQYGLFEYSASNEITTTEVLGGSNGASAVNFSAGTKDIVAGPVGDAPIDGGSF